MGNLCTCLPQDQASTARRISGHGFSGSSCRWNRPRSSRRGSVAADAKMDDPLLRDQTLAAAIFHRQQSATAGFGSTKGRQVADLPRSSSCLTGPLLQPDRLVDQDPHLDDSEPAHFVLIHGGGFGAWCWYKTIALLEEGGFRVTTIDLTGCGTHPCNTSVITSLSQYVKPLTEFLYKLTDGEKVILVGHDLGGACVSYAMELAPQKISKAVFIAAAMLTSGQSTLELFSNEVKLDDPMSQARKFLYANGRDQSPTAIDFEKSLLRDLLFNQSPEKDIALASVSMKPVPFGPVVEKLALSDQNHGSIKRFYIQTQEDNAIPITLQEKMVNSSPPEQVFLLKGADHSPFFSKPQTLHKLLVHISKLP